MKKIDKLFKQKQTSCPVHIIDTNIENYPAMPLTEDSVLNIYMKEQDSLGTRLSDKPDIDCRINKNNYDMLGHAHGMYEINDNLIYLVKSTIANRSYLLIRQFLEDIGYYDNTNPEIEQYIAALISDDRFNRMNYSNIRHLLSIILENAQLNTQIPQADWNFLILSITNIFEMNMYEKFSNLMNVLLLYMDIPKNVTPLNIITAMTNIANSIIVASHDGNIGIFADTISGVLNATATIKSNPYYQEKLPRRYNMFSGFDDLDDDED